MRPKKTIRNSATLLTICPFSSPLLENKRVEFAGERAKYLLHAARYPKRDAKLDTIQKFWQRAIQHSADLSQFTVLEEDQKALQFLAKMRAWRDPEQVEAFGYELVSAMLLGGISDQMDCSTMSSFTSTSSRIRSSPTLS